MTTDTRPRRLRTPAAAVNTAPQVRAVETGTPSPKSLPFPVFANTTRPNRRRRCSTARRHEGHAAERLTRPAQWSRMSLSCLPPPPWSSCSVGAGNKGLASRVLSPARSALNMWSSRAGEPLGGAGCVGADRGELSAHLGDGIGEGEHLGGDQLVVVAGADWVPVDAVGGDGDLGH